MPRAVAADTPAGLRLPRDQMDWTACVTSRGREDGGPAAWPAPLNNSLDFTLWTVGALHLQGEPEDWTEWAPIPARGLLGCSADRRSPGGAPGTCAMAAIAAPSPALC